MPSTVKRIRNEEMEAFKDSFKNPGIFKHVSNLFFWFRKVGVSPAYFFLSIVCTFFSLIFNLFGLRLFIPFLQGLMRGNFTKIHDKLHVIELLRHKFPATFATSRSLFFLLLAMILVSFIVKNILDFVSALCLGQQIRQADSNIRRLLLGRYLSFGKYFFDCSNVANVSYKIMDTSNAVTGQIRALKTLLTQVMTLTAYLGVMLWISWPLTLAALAIFPAHHVITAKMARRIKSISKAQESTRVNFAEQIFNIFSCIPLVKAYAAEEHEQKRLTYSSDDEIRAAYQMQKRQLLVKPIQDINTMISLLVLVLVMTFLMRGPHKAPSYLVFFFVVRKAMPNFAALANFRLSVASVEGVFERLRRIFDDNSKFIVSDGTEEFKGLREGIEFRNLSFSYRTDIPVLRDVQFSVEKGKMTAVVGTTGAGKSTIVQLLMRFYDCPPGTILIDGEDIRRFTIKSLVGRIAFVSQETMLFNDTLRANFLYGLRPELIDGKLDEAIEKAQLGELVRCLPEGLDTFIGDRGVKLSGGERQRVAIARAFLKGAEILILDEATSALDTKTERQIQDAIDEVVLGRTAIVIAHRLSTIVNADKIVVLEKGSAVEQGSLKELLDKQGIFYGYWKAQDHSQIQEMAVDEIV